jgi:hypothetical protein
MELSTLQAFPVWSRNLLHSGRIRRPTKDILMNSLPLQPIIAILAGILILLRPALLNYVVALYLIIIGILGLMGNRRI